MVRAVERQRKRESEVKRVRRRRWRREHFSNCGWNRIVHFEKKRVRRNSQIDCGRIERVRPGQRLKGDQGELGRVIRLTLTGSSNNKRKDRSVSNWRRRKRQGELDENQKESQKMVTIQKGRRRWMSEWKNTVLHVRERERERSR